MNFFRSCALALALIFFQAISAAADAHSDRLDQVAVVQSFYDALADLEQGEAALATLLPDAATVELRDLGITQTAAEFVESMDGFREALEGGSIVHRVEPASEANVVSVLVCYRFASNTVASHERFEFSDNRIMLVVQESSGDDCSEL